MSQYKILMLSDWFAPAYKAGGPITALNNLTKKIDNNIIVTVLTSAYDLGEHKILNNIVPDVWQNINNKTRIKYLTNVNDVKKEFEKEEFDAIYLNSMFSPAFTLKPLLFAKRKRIINRVILAPRGMLAEGALSLKSFKKKLFLQFFKLLGIHKSIRFHATSYQEIKDIKNIFGNGVKIIIIPDMIEAPLKNQMVRNKNIDELKLISITRVAPEKNIKYLIELLKEIKGDISLIIYGMIKTEAYLKECSDIIRKLPPNIKVNIAGEIPSHFVKEKLRENHFFILPTLGENFGHAIYEALSSGTPVIISDKTPWRNLEQKKAGWDISLDDRERFIEVLNKCAQMANEEYQQWGDGAYEFAHKYYQNNDVTESYLKLFSNI